MRRKLNYEVLSPREAGIEVHNLVRSDGETDRKRLTVEVCHDRDSIELLLLRGFCPTGGYDLQILDVSVSSESEPAEVSVLVNMIDPRSEDMVTMAFTRPAKVVRLSSDQLPQKEELLITVRDSESRLLAKELLRQ